MTATSGETRIGNGRARILIVDADSAFVRTARALLEAEGYAVENATTVKDALAMTSERAPDLVVLDVMTAQDKAPTVKFTCGFESLRHIPIVMLSSVPVTPPCRPRSAGGLDVLASDVCLAKPLDPARLLTAVRTLLTRQQSVATV